MAYAGSRQGGAPTVRRRELLAGTAGLAAAAPIGRHAHAAVGLRRIAFGSCADQEREQPIWAAVLAYRPELFLFLGDNVYGDVSSAEMRELRAAYGRAAEIPGYRRLRQEVSCLATWDDHDYGRNDAGGDFPFKAQSKELFLEFWQAPADDPRRARQGVYDARIFGPDGRRVQVVMLDTRWSRSRPAVRVAGAGQRTLDDAAGASVLGDAQWAWLADRLREPADLRLVCSSVQVVAEGHRFERWGNFPSERQRLFELIGETGAGGVVFLSGDRHFSAVYETTERTPYRFVELTSSGINQVWPTPSDLQGNRIGTPFAAENFGTVDIDWTARAVRLTARDINGRPAREIALDLDSLTDAR